MPSPICRHLDLIRDVEPLTPAGCEECLRSGGTWVHLRLCLICGHVGCCDNSPGRHATAHYRHTGHPLVRSFEPGEDWAYCYADDAFFEPAPRAGEPGLTTGPSARPDERSP